MERTINLYAWLFSAAFAVAPVPNAATATSPGATSIPVPSVTILQGDVLADHLIREQAVVVGSKVLKDYFTSRDAVIGKVARRVLPKGHAIPINSLRDPYLFKEGERVSLNFRQGGLSIEATGVALQPGVQGALVSVRNADTGVVIRGVVQANGSVQVGEN